MCELVGRGQRKIHCESRPEAVCVPSLKVRASARHDSLNVS